MTEPAPPDDVPTSPQAPASRGRERLRQLVELFALCGFVVAQPVFDVLSRAGDLLILRKVGRAEVLVLALALVIVPPLVLWAAELAVAAAVPRVRKQLHTAVVGVLLGLFVLQVVQTQHRVPRLGVVVLTMAAAVGLTAAYWHWPVTRTWLLFAAPAPLVFSALFLSSSPVAAMLASSPGKAVAIRDAGASPVVALVFDELPLASMVDGEGRIDARLYPNFAALAEEATFYRNATGIAARTPHALPSMLTGRLPRQPLPPVTARYPANVFALLSSTHEVRALESITALCPRDVCPRNEWGRPSDRKIFHDAVQIWLRRLAPGDTAGRSAGTWLAEDSGGRPVNPEDAFFLVHRLHEDQPAHLERFLRSMDGRGTTFHFAHVVLPHAPWHYLPDGMQYPDKALGMVSYEERTPEPWPAVVDRQRHVLQTMYVDRLLGRAVARMRQVGLYDRAALLVTADHGISFQPGLPEGTRTLRPENQHEVAWVPLLLKAPGQRTGAVRDDNVMGVDMAPTIAQLAGVRIPWEVEGRSVLGPPRRTSEKVWFNEPGEPVRLDTRRALTRVFDAPVERLLLAEEGQQGAYKLRAFADLLGRRAPPLAGDDGPSVVAKVEDLAAVHQPDPSSGQVPSLVTGFLDVPDGAPRPDGVALVLNGTVAGASKLYAEADQPNRFAAVVPPQLLHPGRNDLEVVLMDRQADAVSYRRASVEPA